jgi:hypothetical protein
MASVGCEMLSLEPRPSVGSVYFSQAHALRWVMSSAADPVLLYREILSHALFFEVLIISDSHAIQNWQLMEMLPGGRFSGPCPGIDKLFRSGVIRLACRKDASLDATARGQIRRKVPVMVEGRLGQMTENFLHYADQLAELCSGQGFTFDAGQIKLADRILSDILDIDSVSSAYGIKSVRLRRTIAKTVESLADGGRLFAADLFNYPEKYPGPLAKQPHRQLIQRLATSAHACNFIVTFGLLPVVSPNSDDHIGATAFYERFVPEIRALGEEEDVLLAGEIVPMKVVPTVGPHSITRNGVERILRLRSMPEFRTLQERRSRLLRIYRESSAKADPVSRSNTINEEEQILWALARYLAKVAHEYGVTDSPENIPSGFLQKVAFATTRETEAFKENLAMENWFYVGIGGLITALVAMGVVPHAMLLATGGMFLTAFTERKRVISKLRQTRKIVDKASRLINLVHVSDVD